MDKGYALIHGVILDGSREMEPQTGKVIFVEGKTITAIRNEGIDLDGYQVIDLAGQYIMPGLINLHVHIPGTGKPKKKPQDVRKLVRKVTANGLMRRLSYGLCTALVRPEVYSGVTTIRTVGGILDYDSRLRDEINAGKKTGPRILAANMAVSVPGGHMAGVLAYEAETEDDCVKYVDLIAKDKPDLIKIMVTGGVLDAKVKGEPGKAGESVQIKTAS